MTRYRGIRAALAFALLTVWVLPCLAYEYPVTEKRPTTDVYHGVEIVDDYAWLEDEEADEVVAWTEEQEVFTHSLIDDLPQREFLTKRFNELWRYDDEGTPNRVLQGERIFYWSKKKDDEKWVYNTKANEDAETQVLLDPNSWDPTETLSGVNPSRNGKYVAFGTAHGGDENPIIQVMVTETGEILDDSLLGWKQSVISWLPDNSGFFYTCKPLEGEVAEGEHEYWHATWLHQLGTPPAEDQKVFWHDETKEYWHMVWVTEDGKYEVYNRSLFNTNEAYFKPLGSDGDPIPLATGFENEYDVDIIEGKILIRTDEDAPLFQVFITDVDQPERENWREFIPEHERDKLNYISAINGHIYASYSHNAYSQVKIYDLDGNYLRDLPFPTIGTGGVGGHWSQPEVWVGFSSYTYPSTTFKYHFEQDELEIFHEFPLDIDVDNMTAKQVWFESKDGTQVSMFVVHRKDLELDGDNPTLVNGYGGFNISRRPRFSTMVVVWLEAGGVYVDVNLRGGGEYGQEWHEAGMLGNKQNVFDDFIGAAEWLIENKYTSSERIGIRGGSNGGLLTGACTVQRPDLYKVVYCGVPLLDMLKYHKFGLANIWSEEYGSSDDAEQFEYLRAYSPYHNAQDNVAYPAFIVTGSENDARVDPMHARKMAARLQAADAGGGPVVLLIRKQSGHGGGTTLSKQIEQQAEVWAFLMDQLGMQAP